LFYVSGWCDCRDLPADLLGCPLALKPTVKTVPRFHLGQWFRRLTAGYAVLRNFSGVMNHGETVSLCLAGISLGVLALTLAVALVASMVPVTGRIIMSLLWIGELLRSLQSKISRHRDGLGALFDLYRGKRDRIATA
jgi:hypothetical protein